jgi:hypothetical protein
MGNKLSNSSSLEEKQTALYEAAVKGNAKTLEKIFELCQSSTEQSKLVCFRVSHFISLIYPFHRLIVNNIVTFTSAAELQRRPENGFTLGS